MMLVLLPVCHPGDSSTLRPTIDVLVTAVVIQGLEALFCWWRVLEIHCKGLLVSYTG